MADWIAAIGQAIGAVFTALAVAVALWIASKDRRNQKSDELRQAHAQARLTVVGWPSMAKADFGDGWELRITIHNHGDRSILAVNFEAWTGSTGLDALPNVRIHAKVLVAGDSLRWRTGVKGASGPAEPRMSRWRVRWTDADGRCWATGWSNGHPSVSGPFEDGGDTKRLEPELLDDSPQDPLKVVP
jgi:hypothetical protein